MPQPHASSTSSASITRFTEAASLMQLEAVASSTWGGGVGWLEAVASSNWVIGWGG